MEQKKAKRVVVATAIVSAIIMVAFVFGMVVLINSGVRIGCSSLPSESEVVSNLEKDGYEVEIDADVTRADLEKVLMLVIGSCREQGVGDMLLDAYDFDIRNAFSKFDKIEKILVANRYRVGENIIDRGEVIVVEEYFGTGIIVFYFDSEDSAESFYDDLDWVFDNIAVYYERTVYNVFDDEIKYGVDGNKVFLGSEEAFDSSLN